jgi:hypothetical protein
VTNLDVFMRDVYEYYLGNGFWCIICERMLHLLYVPYGQWSCPSKQGVPLANESIASLPSSPSFSHS